MSLGKLSKQLDRFETEFHLKNHENRRRKAFLMSDSKGNYLQRVVERGQDIFDIVFQKGASSENRHLLSKILDVVRGVDSPLLMIWTGTCDFTKFDRRTRYLSLDEDVSVADVVDKLQNIKREVLKVNASTEVIFLQCPVFSIRLWNEYQKHSKPDSFKDDDEALFGKIGNLNDEIDSINSTRSPPFSLDLLRASKVRRGRSQNRIQTKYAYNFKDLYKDGIHPIDTLAKLWLRKLQQIVIEKCF